jgi:hypothetical protein
LIVLGLCFILLLERGPGREHIAIQSYMLAMVAGLGALYAGALAIGPVRDFFELELLSAGYWFISLACVAGGLAIAAVGWRLPIIQRLEAPDFAPAADDLPAATHRSQTTERPALPPDSPAAPSPRDARAGAE